MLHLLSMLLQSALTVAVTIQLRHVDSSSFTNRVQIRTDEGEPFISCMPDPAGRCTLQLARGLYLVEPTGIGLDAVSASAAVEIGGRWLGITVGDQPITYGFVVEGRALYFDQTPDQAQPQPYRPTQRDIDDHFAVEPSVEQPSITASTNSSEIAVTSTPQTDATILEGTSKVNRQTSWWAWILIPLLALAVFAAWLLWVQRSQSKKQDLL